MESEVRDPKLDDCDELGRIHVRAWQHAYRGVMPDAYLDGLVATDRAAMWRRKIESDDGRGLLVQTLGGRPVGFVAFGPEEGRAEAEAGELYALNIDPEHWGRGFGRALVRAATEQLRQWGYRDLVLWVVPQNERAVRLYVSEGWAAEGVTKCEEILGVTVTDARYRRAV